MILWSLTAILSGFVLVPTYLHSPWAFVPLVIALLVTAAFALLGRETRVREAEHRGSVRARVSADTGEIDAGGLLRRGDPDSTV